MAKLLTADELKDLKDQYTDSVKEADQWREDYPEYERLANNELMDDLDENMPEVNDGSLAAALFKLPKRIVSNKLSGTVKALDRDEAWVAVLANLVWRKKIIPQANTQAPFIRKWKDAVRKAGIYGSVPLITLFVDDDDERHADFIVGQPQDVKLQAGRISDYDSKDMFWDVYFDKGQVEEMIEQAVRENKEAKENPETDPESFNQWNPQVFRDVLKNKQKSTRPGNEESDERQDTTGVSEGYHFIIQVRRGVNATFRMFSDNFKDCAREWSNPDPSGDSMIHFLYCYQDFINPYGIGIVKLAGPTQNVMDFMRQSDVKATAIGIEPPTKITGDDGEVDVDSIVFAQRAQWFVGNADAVPVNVDNNVYAQLPNRMQMYQASLNKILPTGDTSVSADAGDPTQSKTPAGVKLQAANLSIDDEDFKDNLYITYAAVAKSMINTHFANMQGSDLLKLTDDERDMLIAAGMDFPLDENGNPGNQLDVVWDTVRGSFDFEVDPEVDKAQDDADKLKGLTDVATLLLNPATTQLIQAGPINLGTKKLDVGELFSEIIGLTTDNDKVLQDITPEEKQEDEANQIQAQIAQQQAGQMPQDSPQPQTQVDPTAGQPMQQPMAEAYPEDQLVQPPQEPPQVPSEDELMANVQGIMQQYGVDEQTAITALAAEEQGADAGEIIAHLQAIGGQQ